MKFFFISWLSEFLFKINFLKSLLKTTYEIGNLSLKIFLKKKEIYFDLFVNLNHLKNIYHNLKEIFTNLKFYILFFSIF